MKNQNITARIRIIVEDLGGKKKYLGEKLGVDPSYVTHWIKRGNIPSGELLKAFKEKLNININWLLTGDGDKYLKPGKLPGEYPINLTALGPDEEWLIEAWKIAGKETKTTIRNVLGAAEWARRGYK